MTINKRQQLEPALPIHEAVPVFYDRVHISTPAPKQEIDHTARAYVWMFGYLLLRDHWRLLAGGAVLIAVLRDISDEHKQRQTKKRR